MCVGGAADSPVVGDRVTPVVVVVGVMFLLLLLLLCVGGGVDAVDAVGGAC